MGKRIRFTCKNCGKGYEGDMGGGKNYALFRCEQCNREQTHPRPFPLQKAIKCEHCGGRLSEEIPPLCPACGSKDIVWGDTVLTYE